MIDVEGEGKGVTEGWKDGGAQVVHSPIDLCLSLFLSRTSVPFDLSLGPRFVQSPHVATKGKGVAGPCPYFLSRAFAREAEIVLLPYNYLVDAKTRKGLKEIALDGSVVVVDEAHNIEQVCSDAASFELTAFQVHSAAEEVGTVLEWYRLIEQGDEPAPPNFGLTTADNLAVLRQILRNLSEKLDAALDSCPNRAEHTHPGGWPFLWLAEAGVKGVDAARDLLTEIQNVVTVAAERDSGAVGVGGSRRGASGALSRFSEDLESLLETDQCLPGREDKVHSCFQAHLKRERVGRGDQVAMTTRLSFWCFSPAVGMQGVARAGVRSVVLTSGTLSPLSSFAYELGLPFPVRLENKHVVSSGQVRPTEAHCAEGASRGVRKGVPGG